MNQDLKKTITECNDLPEGWDREYLGKLCSIVTGKKDVNAETLDGKYPFFTCAREEHRINDYSFEGESILVAGNGFFNVKYYDGQFDAYQRTYVLQNFLVDGRYLFHWISQNLDNITKDNRGSTIRYIRLGDLTDHVVSIPPVAEQKRITAKIEDLLPSVNATKKRLERATQIIERFRQAVLSTACSGKLTEMWRQNNNVITIANELSNIQELSTIELPEIPDEWSYVSLGSMTKLCQYGTSIKANTEAKDAVPVIRMGNIQDGLLDYTDLKYISQTYELVSFILEEGDLLFNRTNSPELVGKSAVFHSTIKAFFASYLIRLKLDKNRINPDYVCYWLNSMFGRSWAREVKTDGVSQSNINAKKLLRMPMPITSLEEQDEIVHRVKILIKLADTIGKRIETAKLHAEKLIQSILAKGFRGELVPTEAEVARQEGRSYEPASVLLERIRLSKEKNVMTKGKHMPKQKSTKSTQTRIPLLRVLEENEKPMTPEQLFREAGFEPSQVDSFYRELLLIREKLDEIKPEISTARLWPHDGHFMLRLKKERE